MSKFVEKLETYDPLVLRDMMQELRAENKKLKQQLDDGLICPDCYGEGTWIEEGKICLDCPLCNGRKKITYKQAYEELVSKIKQFHEEFETTTGNDEERYNELFAEELK